VLLLASEIILAPLLSGSFGLEDTEVKATWCGLCSDLVSVGVSPTLLHVLWNKRAAVDSEELVKGMWQVIGRRYTIGNSTPENWVDLVAFLTIPFLRPQTPVEGKAEAFARMPYLEAPANYFQWKLSVAEQETWTTLLRHVLHLAVQGAITQETVVSHLLEGMELLTPSVDEELQNFYQAHLCLAEVLGLIGEAALANDQAERIRRLASSAITRLYCQEGWERGLDALDRFFKPWMGWPSIPVEDRGSLQVDVMELMFTFQPSICQWIEDVNDLLDQEGHMRLVRPSFFLVHSRHSLLLF
jgi:hypothetical protein